jgi:hypothetical protein
MKYLSETIFFTNYKSAFTMKVISTLFAKLALIYCAKTQEAPNFICNDGHSVNIRKICDGIKDCSDGSDEVIKLCKRTM